MKKFVCAILALMLVLSLAACAPTTNNETTAATTGETTVATTEATTGTTETTEATTAPTLPQDEVPEEETFDIPVEESTPETIAHDDVVVDESVGGTDETTGD